MLNTEQAACLGSTVGLFQKMLADLPGPRLHETIPAFHDMEKRYGAFWKALAEDRFGRAGEAGPEIAFMEENEERGTLLTRLIREGSLPERICHNDTKMSNILLDAESGRALCMVDLDTVMPGSALFDSGDLIRTVATTCGEEETDLGKVRFDPALYRALVSGYLGQAAGFLTPAELGLVAESGRNITQIMGIRFLTDWLDGDRYYRTNRPGQNLDRCRNQIALIRSMDDQWEAILKATDELVGLTFG